MASIEQFRKIAVHCSQYSLDEGITGFLTNISDEKFESCTNCEHFTNGHSCDLDLIDKVLSSLAMETEFKS